MKFLITTSGIAALCLPSAFSFAPPPSRSVKPFASTERFTVIESDTAIENDIDDAAKTRELERSRQKQALLGLLGGARLRSSSENDVTSGAAANGYDPIFVDPISKEPLAVSLKGPILGTSSSSGISLQLRSSTDSSRVFSGRTDSYINLLEPSSAKSMDEPSLEDEVDDKTSVSSSPILSSLLTLTPPPLRSIVARASNNSFEYIPMRDLFTSPSVSFAYERGWRQGFQAAGFPGPDREWEMARDYFSPVVSEKKMDGKPTVVVDMSCATGLFTRRFAKSNEYTRVIGCDYSDSMLTEARRRIRADPELGNAKSNANNNAPQKTRLDLIRCDVANIPFKSSSIDALHAGAAMHCWPEIEQSLEEIHRVLVPGGRYFATTFLGNYFSTVSGMENAASGGKGVGKNLQAFQYFPSVEHLRDLLIDAGFEKDKVDVELVGRSCVIIRCEK